MEVGVSAEIEDKTVSHVCISYMSRHEYFDMNRHDIG